MLKEFHRTLVFREFLFFGAKLRRMRLSPATCEAHGVFQVKHFMVEDVSHYVIGNIFPIKLAVDHDLLKRGIETS